MRKKGYATGIFLMALITLALIAAGVGTPEWTVAKMEQNRSINENCVVTRTLGLFTMKDSENGDCSGNPSYSGTVYDKNYLEFSYGLQYAVTAFCGISIVMCVVIMGVSAFNICTNPFETYLSAVGLMAYNIAGLIASLLAVILYTVLLYTELEQPINETRPSPEFPYLVYRSEDFYLPNDAYFGYSFFLVVVSILTYVLGVVLAFLSERDTVEKVKKVFSPPKEETPDEKMEEIIMY